MSALEGVPVVLKVLHPDGEVEIFYCITESRVTVEFVGICVGTILYRNKQ
jgi:hypothetical protein